MGSHVAHEGLKVFYVFKDGLGYLTFLSPLPKVWVYRNTPAHLICALLGMEPRTTWMLGKHYTNIVIPPACLFLKKMKL